MRKTLGCFVAVVLCVVLGSTARASAHEGEGRIEVLAADAAGDGTVTYRLRVTYVADGHLAPESTITALVVDPADPQAPQPLAKIEDGVYGGTVRFPRPGPATVRFTSLRPIAALEIPQEAPTPTTTATIAPTTTTTAAASTTEPPEDPGAESSTAGVVPLVVVAAAVVGGGAVLLARGRGSRSRT